MVLFKLCNVALMFLTCLVRILMNYCIPCLPHRSVLYPSKLYTNNIVSYSLVDVAGNGVYRCNGKVV